MEDSEKMVVRSSEAGIEQSVGSVRNSYDSALTETNNGLYKTRRGVIHRRSWKNLQEVDLAILDWLDWFDHKRLLGLIGSIQPVEAEAAYYRQQVTLPMAA